MMSHSLPETADDFKYWDWSQIEPYYQELVSHRLTANSLHSWLADWTRVADLVSEARWSLYIDMTLDTTDETAGQRYVAFFENIYPPAQEAEQKLKQKLLDSGLEPDGFDIPLRSMRAEAALFREENLPLIAEEHRFSSQYEKIFGSQTVEWEGKEVTIPQLAPVYLNPDRDIRERAWRLAQARILADREAISENWCRLMDVRGKLSTNAGLPDYRAYRWQQMKRLDYTPEDCATFRNAIEQVVVPAAQRAYERRQEQLGVDTLRPWDLNVDPLGRPPLHPYQTAEELEDKTGNIFQRIDPQLANHYELMRREGLLDLENRKGKAPGAYCTALDARKKPFIFMNAVGLHDDVMTLIHEAGHAFHALESAHLPYYQQRGMTAIREEVAEVASTVMELLASPCLTKNKGGFYSKEDAARARIEHLESLLLFLPYMAVVDGFQHWVYTHHDQASSPANCDVAWTELWQRFMIGVDYSELEDIMTTGWQRKVHIHTDPFYYVDYGFAQIGALQIWCNSLDDQAGAVARYRHVLSLGGTVNTPDFYSAAGAKFEFGVSTLRDMVDLIEKTIEELNTT